MSAKTSTQPGRRTPLSLTGAVSKGQSNKGVSNSANNNGNNANGHTMANNNKQENKLQQQKTDQQKSNNSEIKENPHNNKKIQQQQSDKKQQHQQQQQQQNEKKSVEKNQNGVNNSKQQQQQTNENKQIHQQNKESKEQNGNNKVNENDKKEKLEKQQDKIEKLEAKSKDYKKLEPEIQENDKKDEKKIKEVKDTKEKGDMVDKNEIVNKVNENTQNELHEKNEDKKTKIEEDIDVANQKMEEEKNKEIGITEEEQKLQQKSPIATPKTNRTNKTLTPVHKTPTEKTPQKLTTLNSAIKTTPITKREVTTTIDDVEMEPLTVESSPIKSRQPKEVTNINIAPSATSTPGKIVLPKRSSAAPKSDVQLAMQSGYSPERPRAFSQISGRKSIRPITDYTPSKFQSNPQFRESYRRINTELDVTNTSMNVTVGSEVPNNFSFSFFGRGRKRDRTPSQHSQYAIGEFQTDMEVSPPKKARFEGFFSVVSSPLTLLRNRFSKATLQSSTPVKLEEKLNIAEDEIEVQNVSGLSIHQDLTKNEKEAEISTASGKDATLDKDFKEAKSNSAFEEDLEDKDVFFKNEKSCDVEKNIELSDIKITETPLQVVVGDPLAKNKKCIVM